jgi:magnesium-transporting ATPase (P-type)
MKISIPKSVTTTLFITLITRVDIVLNLINNSFNIVKETDMENTASLINSNPILYWIIQIGITIVIFIIVYQIFKRIYDLQSQLKIHSIISDIRNLNTFKELYKNDEFYLLPNEDIKSYLLRSHSGIYAEKIVQEIKEVRNRAINQMSDKTIKEIDKLIIKSYGLKRNK